jgi:hypothetical protein
MSCTTHMLFIALGWRMTPSGATCAFSRRPLPRAYRPFIGPIFKVGKGSNCRVRSFPRPIPVSALGPNHAVLSTTP